MEKALLGGIEDDFDGRPELPSRPNRPASGGRPPVSQDASIRRKPVSCASLQSLNKASYERIDLKEVRSMETFNSIESVTCKPLAPKAFHKTHKVFGLNLGYWRMPVRHFSIFSILFLVTFLPLYYIGKLWYTVGRIDYAPFESDCYGSGGWSFIGLNLRFGSFDYGTSRSLDLAWNWIVGRGVQGLLTILAYRVFGDALLRAAELTPLSFELYAALGLYSTKPEILWQLLKAIRKYGNWRVKCIVVWLLISTIYLLFVPSLLDACSGYEASQRSLFRWPDSTIQSSHEVSMIWQNASLSGPFRETIVEVVPICATWYSKETDFSVFNVTFVPLDQIASQSPDDYKQESYSYAMYKTSNLERVGNPLYGDNNCSNFSAARGEVPGYRNVFVTLDGMNWKDSVLNETWWNHFFRDPANSQWPSWDTWQFYPVNRSNFMCETQNNEYQWGFSYEWLFVVFVINSVWLVGLWILWVDCDTNSEFCRKRRGLGTWRAVADLSEAMREELGPNLCAYSDSELAKALRDKPPIKYYSRRGTETEPGHIGLSSRPSGRLRLRWDHEYGKKTL